MKIGIFSDIHGNIYAFEKVISSIRKNKPDLYVFCGDICGYYYYQNEIIEMLRSLDNLICVRGNHDEFFLEMLNDSSVEERYNRQYGKSKSCTLLKKRIAKTNLQFLNDFFKSLVSGS